MNSNLSMFSKLLVFVALVLQVQGLSISQLGPHGLMKRDAGHVQLQARQAEVEAKAQEQGAKAPEGESQPTEKLSPAEESAGKLFELIIKMGNTLENVTSLGSTPEEILKGSQSVIKIVPETDSLRNNLLASVSNKGEKINTAVSSATSAGEKMAKALEEITKKPEDANLIKSQYSALEESFKSMLFASDEIATAAIPKLAEAVASEKKEKDAQPTGQKEAQPAAQQDAQPNGQDKTVEQIAAEGPKEAEQKQA